MRGTPTFKHEGLATLFHTPPGTLTSLTSPEIKHPLLIQAHEGQQVQLLEHVAVLAPQSRDGLVHERLRRVALGGALCAQPLDDGGRGHHVAIPLRRGRAVVGSAFRC